MLSQISKIMIQDLKAIQKKDWSFLMINPKLVIIKTLMDPIYTQKLYSKNQSIISIKDKKKHSLNLISDKK